MAADTDFEAPLRELEKRIEELAALSRATPKEAELGRLRRELDEKRRTIFARLTPWQKTQVARHPDRPYTLDYVEALFTEFTELHGDRRFGDDPALVCGFAFYKDRPGRRDRPPEGPRHQAEDLPQLRHAQARGLSQGAARDAAGREVRAARSSPSSTRPAPTPASTRRSAARRRPSPSTCARWRRLPVPIVVNVTGEGGSGGALAIAVGDRVNMLEHSVYSVITPEGCAVDPLARRRAGPRRRRPP